MAIRLPTNLSVLDFTSIENTRPGCSFRLSTCRFARAAHEKNHGYSVVSEDKISPKLRENPLAKLANQLPTNLPVLDLTNVANLKPDTSSRLSACKDVRDALEEYGCFVVSYDKFSPKLKEDVYLAIKELFDLPTEKKQDYNSVKPFMGYFLYPNAPLFESMTILDTRNAETSEDFINFMLPPGNEQFSKSLDYYRNQVAELQGVIMRMVFESYGIEKSFDSHKDSTVYLFRINKYRAPRENENSVGIAVHTDQTFITVLSSNQAQGLEIKGNDGNWIPVYCPPSSFAVITGDAMEAWSNGRIRSCLHRVTMTAKEERYSIGIFFMQKGTVATPKELVDDEYPSLYKPFDHFDLLRYALSSEAAHLLGSEKLVAYCGVNVDASIQN